MAYLVEPRGHGANLVHVSSLRAVLGIFVLLIAAGALCQSAEQPAPGSTSGKSAPSILWVAFHDSVGDQSVLSEHAVKDRKQLREFMTPRLIAAIQKDFDRSKLLVIETRRPGAANESYRLDVTIANYSRHGGVELEVQGSLFDLAGTKVWQREYESKSRRGWVACCIEIVDLVYRDAARTMSGAPEPDLEGEHEQDEQLSPKERLLILKGLLDDGLISEEEYEERRKAILESI